MKWNVLYYSFHKKQIETYNIFHHSSFHHAFYEIAQTCKDKGHFAEELWNCLMYYFWSKSEYEILIYPYIPSTRSHLQSESDMRFLEEIWYGKTLLKGGSFDPPFSICCDMNYKDAPRYFS